MTQAIHLAHVTSDGKGLYDQDVAVLEAQQKAIERQPRMPFYNLNIDAGALWARRKIDRMLGAERSHRDAADGGRALLIAGFETRGVAALLTMRAEPDLILNRALCSRHEG